MGDQTPTGITVDRNERTMTVRWSDGVESRIPFSLLRAACPCAQCRGGHENMSARPDPDLFIIPLSDSKENEVADVRPVGNYGITVAWKDGHQFGIYTWGYLRELGDGAAGRNT